MNKQNASISVILALLMIATPLAAMPFVTGEMGTPVETPMFTGGDGSIGAPYWIVNVSDLQNMSLELDAHYKLVNDIDASNTSLVGHWANHGGLGFDPIGDVGTPFSGSLDGQNYTVSNLYIDRPSDNYVALIGNTNTGALIEDVHLVGADITGNQYSGGLVGVLRDATASYNSIIVNCSVEGDVSGIASLGPLVGYIYYAEISGSYTMGTVTGSSSRIGGLVGLGDTSHIDNCYSLVDVIGSDDVGGFIGQRSGAQITNSYCTGQVIGNTDVGGFSGIDSGGSSTNCFWDTDTSGQATSAGGEAGLNTTDMLNSFTYTNAGWNFTNTWFSVNGSTRPFLQMEYDTNISNSHQLQLMQMNLTANYTLANDIDMDITNNASMWGTSISDGEGFVPIGIDANRFIGSLDGKNFTINNLYINRSSENYVGLFGYLDVSANISKISLIDCAVNGNQYVGGLAGYLGGTSTVYKSSSTGHIIGGVHVGGLVGHNNGDEISYSYSAANVDGSYAGGLVGISFADISFSYATGDVISVGSNRIGGLIGNVGGGTIFNCYATGDVTGDDYAGGLIGNNFKPVSNCTSNGTVTGNGDNIGGLIGFSDGPVSNSKSFGEVLNTAGHSYTGGLIGRQDGSTVSSCEAHGNVTGSNGRTGGLVGFTRWGTIITDCSAYGVTKGNFNTIGGLIGENWGTILDSHSYGDTGNNKAWTGGLVGKNLNNGLIQNSSAHGDVFGGSITGGIAGENEGTISNCSYNETVNGTGDTGGIVGRNSGGTVSNCSSNGTVTGDGDNVGGLVGYSTGPISNSTSFGDVFNIAPAGDNYWGTGGLIGKQEGSTVSSSKAYGNVSGCKFFTGGLIGHIAPGTTVMDSSAYGFTIGAGNTIGGLVGRNEGTIINGSAYGDTGDTKSWTGGLVGENYNNALIQNSSASGDVFGNSITGGFVGENEGTIERSYSTGDVIATSDRVGGFVGWNNGNFIGEITDCYSQGNITGGNDDGIGGFVGNHSYSATITNVYSTGLVTGLINTGGLVGTNWISTVTDSHWDVETSGQATSVNGTGHDTIEMMQQATFTNWDFTNIWGIHEANEYPTFQPLVPVVYQADMEITLADLQDPASTNSTLTYMVTLTNHGPDNAANVYVNITLPLGVTFLNSSEPLNVNGRYIDADVGTLLNGDSVVAFINVSVDSFGTGELNCTAFVTSSTLDPGAFDNETYELTQLHLAPVAVNDAETLDEDSGASTIYVLENDTDVENDDIIIDSVTQPNNGTVIITEAGKNLTFEPDADWNGINTFNYTIMDDVGGRDMATVTITVLAVDDASVAVNDTYNVAEDSGATTLDVLVNDYDGDGDAITISTAIQPSNGTISIAAGGLSIDYTPNADFTGTDSFTYNVSSGISPATVTITVTPVNDVPMITTADNTTAAQDVLYSVDYNATDVDLDTLTWALTTNASWLSIVAIDGVLSGTPTGPGVYWVNVTVDDGNGGLDWSNFTLTVTGTEIIIEPTDTDGDGVPDDQDEFPNDANETTDTDGDGTGDNADEFPSDPDETTDTDGDGTGDNADAFPDDIAASVDADADGYPDEWNDGYTADDSTTGLVLDDDVEDADAGDDTGSSSWLYIILILVIVGAIAGYLIMRGKGKEPVEEDAPEEAESMEAPEEIAEPETIE